MAKSFHAIIAFLVCAFCACNEKQEKAVIPETVVSVKVNDSATPEDKERKLFADDLMIATVPKSLGVVSDFGNVFTKEQEDTLTQIIQQFKEKTSNEIAIAWDPIYTGNEDFDDYIVRLANKWGVGEKQSNNGIVIAFSTQLHRMKIANGSGIIPKLSNDETKQIIDKIMVPEFKNDRYYAGIKKGVPAIIAKLE